MDIKKIEKQLKNTIKDSKKIYVVAHDNIDLDAIGALIGIALIVKKYKKEAEIILDDKRLEAGVKKALEKVDKDFKFINKADIKNVDESALIIVDVNKGELICCNDILDKFKEVIIIDHHSINKDTLEIGTQFIYPDISSTCELISELLRDLKIKLTDDYATVLLSGIVLDTNNFVLKTTKKTFFNAYYLLKEGASSLAAQELLKQDLKKFINRQKMLANVKIIKNNIAITRGIKNEIYRREDLAKVADILLLFNNIKTSFVIGHLSKEEIGISARSLGTLNGKIRWRWK